MEVNKSHNIAQDHGAAQEAVLTRAMQSGEAMSIYLVNGIRIGGRVIAIDRYTLLLSNRIGTGAPQLVYKAAISTIAPDPHGR